MTTDGDYLSCWKRSRPCPTAGDGAQSATCRAWYRCEGEGDYVIRWRCQSQSGNAASNISDWTLDPICEGKSSDLDATMCPPPVVCAEDLSTEDPLSVDSLSTDVILVIALGVFALLALFLIIASTYKYWTLRKRLRLRLQRRYMGNRDFPYPLRYHSWWGSGMYGYGMDKYSRPVRPYGLPYTDVYIARPYDTTTFQDQHLLSSSDDSIDNNTVRYPPHQSGVKGQCGEGRLRGDPSVMTGSFVFHSPTRKPEDSGSEEKLPELLPGQSKLHQMKSSAKENERCYHIYKGKFDRSPRTYAPNYVSGSYSGGAHYEHPRSSDVSADMSTAPLVSSIPVPVYQRNGFFKPTYRKHPHTSRQTLRKESHTHSSSESESNTEVRTRRLLRDQVSPYALGLLSHPHGGHIVNSCRNYNIISTETRAPTRGHTSFASNSSDDNSPHHRHRNSHHNYTPGKHNSPDVISSHNFSKKYADIGKTVYRPTIITTTLNSPHPDSEMSTSTNSSLLNTNDNNNNNHNHNNYGKGNTLELSYDSFRNNHLREVANKGAASSSTLDAGFRSLIPSSLAADFHVA